jgi:hypothetical protein
MPPYNLKLALGKVHDKPFNFQLIMGKQKQVLLVTPKPAAKAQVDEAIATAVKGVREAKGICKKVNDEIIFYTKNAPTGMLRTGMKLAFNTNNCKSVAWDLQQLKPGESEEVHTEVVDEPEVDSDTDTTVNSEEDSGPKTTTNPPPLPTTPWIGAKRSQPSTPPPQPPKSSTPPPRPTSPPPGVTPKPPQPTTINQQRPLPQTPEPKVSNTPPPRPTTPPPGVTPKVPGNVPNDGKAQKEAFEKEYRETVTLYHNGDEEMRKIYTEAGQLAGKHDFAKASEALARLKALVANKEKFTQAKAKKQTQRHGRLTEVSGSVQRSYFNAGGAKNFEKENLKAGKEFKAFLEALKTAEAAKGKPNRNEMNQALSDLEAKANAYLQHYYSNDLNDKQRKGKESLRKRSICETTLKWISHWRLAEEITSLGNPPWDPRMEQKAAEVYAKLLFEEGEKTASLNESAGGSGSWWLEKTVWGDKPGDDVKLKRKFIFKPIDSEEGIHGFPKGGSAPREVLGKAFSDLVLGSTGIDLGVAETHLISVDNNMLPDNEGNVDQEKPQQRTGSLQHFAKSEGKIEGELQDFALKKNPNIYKEIPKEECQKIALMDLMTLNMDRHGGNVMLSEKTDENGKKSPALIPIDHGLILPSRQGLNERRTKMGKTHNVLENMPVKDEKFSPEILQKLDLLDPEAVMKAMQASLQTMKDGHPGRNFDDLIPAENLKLQKRAIQFLKRAAKELTVSELFNTLVVDMEGVFDTPDNQMEAGFDKAIAAAKERGAARRELAQMDDAALNKMTDEIHALGWCPQLNERSFSFRSWDLWLDNYGALALKIWKGKVENPETRKEINKLVAELGGPGKVGFQMEGVSLKEVVTKLQEEVERRSKLSPKEVKEKDEKLDAVAKAMGCEKPSRIDRLNAQAFEEAGESPTGREYQGLTYKQKLEAFWRKKIDAIGGENLLKEIVKECPGETGIGWNLKSFESAKAWLEYKPLGGNAKYFTLVGDGDITSVTGRLRALQLALTQETAFKAV